MNSRRLSVSRSTVFALDQSYPLVPCARRILRRLPFLGAPTLTVAITARGAVAGRSVITAETRFGKRWSLLF
jgi:hypothetical protein